MLELPDKVIEHFPKPQNVGTIENYEGIATIINPVCGDVTEITKRIKGGFIEEILEFQPG